MTKLPRRAAFDPKGVGRRPRLLASVLVAAAVVFLVEGSDFITGSLLPVDGGWFLAR